MNQEPSKEGNPKNSAPENPKSQETPIIVIEEGGNQQPVAPVNPIPGAKSISTSKENTSLNTNTDAETLDEEDTEASSPKGSPGQPKRGRKPEKKRREELSYKEVTQGTQHTIP